MKIKKPTEFLCEKCLIKMRDYDSQRKKKWRKKSKKNENIKPFTNLTGISIKTAVDKLWNDFDVNDIEIKKAKVGVNNKIKK